MLKVIVFLNLNHSFPAVEEFFGFLCVFFLRRTVKKTNGKQKFGTGHKAHGGKNAVHEIGPVAPESTMLVGSSDEELQISMALPRQTPLIEAPTESLSYLDDLLEDLPEVNSTNYSETLSNKIDQVLDNQRTLFSNQKVIFSFMSHNR